MHNYSMAWGYDNPSRYEPTYGFVVRLRRGVARAWARFLLSLACLGVCYRCCRECQRRRLRPVIAVVGRAIVLRWAYLPAAKRQR